MAITDPKTYAETMVSKYETLLTRHAGQQSVSVDGQTLSLADLEAKYDFWLRRYQVLAGTRPRVASVNMSGG